MKPWIWLRALAVLLAIFAVGHTFGTATPKVTRGPQEAAVFAAMRSFRFPIMGFQRTYWDFHQGFALIITLQLLLMTVIAWQLSVISKKTPRLALPMAVALQLGCAGLLVLSWIFFFAAPIAISAMAFACSSVAVLQLLRDSDATEVHSEPG